MKVNEQLKLTGQINIKLFNSDGKLADERNIHNVVVTAGKTFLADWLAQATQSDYFMRYLAIGTGTNAAVEGDTALQTEVGTRVAGTLSSSTNVWTNQATFPAANGTGAITEVGILSASTSGTMLARQTFAVINKAAGASIQITWNVTLS